MINNKARSYTLEEIGRQTAFLLGWAAGKADHKGKSSALLEKRIKKLNPYPQDSADARKWERGFRKGWSRYVPSSRIKRKKVSA